MTVKEKEKYNSSDPGTFSQMFHSTVPNAINKIFNRRQCFPRTLFYWHINAVEHNKERVQQDPLQH
jgi:hypothetical protein